MAEYRFVKACKTAIISQNSDKKAIFAAPLQFNNEHVCPDTSKRDYTIIQSNVLADYKPVFL